MRVWGGILLKIVTQVIMLFLLKVEKFRSATQIIFISASNVWQNVFLYATTINENQPMKSVLILH